MTLQGNLSRTAFESALTPAHVMTTQIIQSALMAGVVIFSLGVAFIYSQSPVIHPTEASIETVRTLTFVHLAFLMANVGFSFFFAQKLFSPEAMKDAFAMGDPGVVAQKCILQQRTTLIMRIALLEGSALFGLAVCTIGATNGVLQASSEYWINLLSPFLLIGFGIATFPTKERLIAWFEERFLTP